MKILELRSERHLKYRFSKVEDNLDLSFVDDAEKLTVISCAELVKYKEKKTSFINATTRFNIDTTNDLYLYNLRSTSPFYANIIWDVAHTLDVGKKIYVYEDSHMENLLKSKYYESSFELVGEYGFTSVFLKKQKLICEVDEDLDSWTFGIPVGPEDPTFLNYTVKRLLELNIPSIEIILCGQPNEKFKYFDKVRIVGTDIPAPPVHITKKKNVIALAATKVNLCIFHDRVLLPLNFHEAMLKFGDRFPMVGMQSLYFADYNNLIPRRYSDINTLNKPLKKYVDIENFTKKDIKITSGYEFLYQNPQRTNFGKDYLTGSLYICKTKLWRMCPQNENLYWDEFEDVEHGARIAKMGIPVMINPFSFTQSMNTRSIIHYYGYMNAITHSGNKKLTRSITEILPLIKRKPLFRLTEIQAKRKMLDFIKKYCDDETLIQQVLSAKLNGYARLSIISKIINDSKIPLWDTKQFVKNFNSQILFESMPPEHQNELEKFLSSDANASHKKDKLINLPFLHNQISHSMFHSAFSVNENSWCIKNGFMNRVGNIFSAFYLKKIYKSFYSPLSIKEISRIIRDSSMSVKG